MNDEEQSNGLERKVLEIDTIPFPYIVVGEGPPVLMLHLPVRCLPRWQVPITVGLRWCCMPRRLRRRVTASR